MTQYVSPQESVEVGEHCINLTWFHLSIRSEQEQAKDQCGMWVISYLLDTADMNVRRL